MFATEDIATKSFLETMWVVAATFWSMVFFSYQAPTQLTKLLILESKNYTLLAKFCKKNLLGKY